MCLMKFLEVPIAYVYMSFILRSIFLAVNINMQWIYQGKPVKELPDWVAGFVYEITNTQNGKIVSWYSKKRLAAGKVRVINSYPISGGYCRTYQAYIKLNGKERHMTNNACKYIGSPSWSFYK